MRVDYGIDSEVSLNMKIGHMIKDALRSLFSKPVTVMYLSRPGEKVHPPRYYRGKITYDREKCIGCLLCTRFCPAGAITTTGDGKVAFNIGRCLFCGQCSEICPRRCIEHSQDFEVVAHDRAELVLP